MKGELNLEENKGEPFELIDSLYNFTKGFEVEGHCTFQGFNGDKDATAVVSMYHGVRPANEVLNSLEFWLESSESGTISVHELKKKIEELSRPV